MGKAGLDAVRLVAQCAFDLAQPVEFRRGALGIARGEARIFDQPRVDRTIEAANVDAPRIGVAAIEDRIAAADGLHHFEPAPRIARGLGVGDRSEERRVGKEWVSKFRSRWSPDT